MRFVFDRKTCGLKKCSLLLIVMNSKTRHITNITSILILLLTLTTINNGAFASSLLTASTNGKGNILPSSLFVSFQSEETGEPQEEEEEDPDC